MPGQVRRQPAPRPPPGEQRPPAIPHRTGRAQAVQQQQDGLPAAALPDPQASVHTPQSATAHARAGPPPAGPRARRVRSRGTVVRAAVQDCTPGAAAWLVVAAGQDRGCQPLAAQTSSRHVRSSCGPRSGSAPAALPRMTSVDIAPADQTAAGAMWASYVADSGYDGPLVTAFAFGDSAELADELGLLVLHGPKRATAELVQAFAAQDEPVPRAGDRCLVLGGDGRPLAIVRTTDVRVGPLSSVDDRFAWDEGEGDRTRAWWLDAHTRFFNRQCTAMGLTFSDDIGVVFERFELVWPTIRT
jgi:uncharacterized protein YhfF